MAKDERIRTAVRRAEPFGAGRRELGIRAALGTSPSTLVGGVLADGARLASIGIVALPASLGPAARAVRADPIEPLRAD